MSQPELSSLPATSYATSYASTWLQALSRIVTADELESINHANCSYLSTGTGTPPTLLALKQHAQSLVNLIRMIVVSQCSGNIGFPSQRLRNNHQFAENEALDWLNDLSRPYGSNEQDHLSPLISLMNQLQHEDDVESAPSFCPMTDFDNEAGHDPQEDGSQAASPFRSHQNLAKHVNDCLEVLDSEFSHTGGLLSMLSSDPEEMAGIRNSLLGQWLLHHQHLVIRMQELEIACGKALDVASAKSFSLPRRRTGSSNNKDPSPQDDIIVLESDDQLVEEMHRVLDDKEKEYQDMQERWREEGVSTDRMRMTRHDPDWIARGMVSVEVKSRISRVLGQRTKAPILLQPALQLDKASKHTQSTGQDLRTLLQLPTNHPDRVNQSQDKSEGIPALEKQLQNQTKELMDEKIALNKTISLQDEELVDLREKVYTLEGVVDDFLQGKVPQGKILTSS